MGRKNTAKSSSHRRKGGLKGKSVVKKRRQERGLGINLPPVVSPEDRRKIKWDGHRG